MVDLDAIEARWKATTHGEGRWVTTGEDTMSEDGLVPLVQVETNEDGWVDIPVTAADTRFIAHAHEDVPALVARVRALEAIVSRACADPFIRGREGDPRWICQHCLCGAARVVDAEHERDCLWLLAREAMGAR